MERVRGGKKSLALRANGVYTWRGKGHAKKNPHTQTHLFFLKKSRMRSAVSFEEAVAGAIAVFAIVFSGGVIAYLVLQQ